MSVLVVGEALVDLIVSPDGSTTAVPGGGPFNTARTIARLGVPVAFGGRLSTDAFGRRLGSMLTNDGATVALPARNDLLTTLALAELDDSGAATYRFYTLGTAGPAVSPGDLTLAPGTTLVSVGTLGLILEPIATAAEELVSTLPDDVLLVLDPNCRPLVTPNADEYRARIRRIVPRADVVKVSGDDLEYLYPGLPPIDSARALLNEGARLVLFTDGAASVRGLTRDWELEFLVPPIEVVDTVGAGDAFGGAFIAFWKRNEFGRSDLTDQAQVRCAIEHAITVSGITCQRAGANPPYFHEL
ncbi:MAG: PfkB family carbohydrate kinase [Actinobacteria bacterium]|nr:PfkB family carbohydrate kinase [Actinomycetota bacterium]